MRRDALSTRKSPATEMLVPHAYEALAELKNRGVELYLASGTDEQLRA